MQDNAQLDVGVDTRQEHNSGIEQLEAKGRQSVYQRVRRKSKDLTEELHDLAEKVSNLAEAASVWRALGGFKRNRRNSKDLSEDVLLAAFQQIDKDKSGKIDRTELGDALKAENGNLKDVSRARGLNARARSWNPADVCP